MPGGISKYRCHYCDTWPAGTRDHIVPRSRVNWEEKNRPRPVPIANTVVCCPRCNQAKSDMRSTCTCDMCIAAWTVFGPVGWQDWPTIDPTIWLWHTLREIAEIRRDLWLTGSP